MLPSSSKSIRDPGVHGTPPGARRPRRREVGGEDLFNPVRFGNLGDVEDAYALRLECGDGRGDVLGGDLGEERVVHGDDGLMAGAGHEEQIREPSGHHPEQGGLTVRGHFVAMVRPPRPMTSCPRRRGSGVTSGSKPVA